MLDRRCSCIWTIHENDGFSVPGAIIGGIIGNNVTKNLPDGGTAGAIIGGLFGNKLQNDLNILLDIEL